MKKTSFIKKITTVWMKQNKTVIVLFGNTDSIPQAFSIIGRFKKGPINQSILHLNDLL